MKLNTTFSPALGFLVAMFVTTYLNAQPPKMKMSTEIPRGIATPDKLETRLGALNTTSVYMAAWL